MFCAVGSADDFGKDNKVFISRDKKKPLGFKTYTTHYGWIIQGSKAIDEVLLTVMRAPKSYTKEDIVEINCHGGTVALRKVLDSVLENGCRLASPGEFTRRAFLNGRINFNGQYEGQPGGMRGPIKNKF